MGHRVQLAGSLFGGKLSPFGYFGDVGEGQPGALQRTLERLTILTIHAIQSISRMQMPYV